MVVFKCKMCGGDLDVNSSMTVGKCQYCDSTMTIPKINDDRRTNLFNRANHLRRSYDFDKAMGIYELILEEDSTDPEAYWGIVLCEFGIEYVEDFNTKKRVPTCHRTHYSSILANENYKAAFQYADPSAKSIYETEAYIIEDIQKRIADISSNEQPFDIFICYKETDEAGRRTLDSVLAQQMYYELVQAGYKVFFSRITLEDKLGSEYEPYIFAALNNAKIMVVIGTKPEYFNAVWVKNEWSRYLSLIKGGDKKVLIPAYKDIDPYDLPNEFGTLQAQDMNKLGFMQDFIRGVNKILQDKPVTSTVFINKDTGATNSFEPLLKRMFMFLEDGYFYSADRYCEKVLDQNPEEYMAYLGKLMIERRVRYNNYLANVDEPLDRSLNYNKAIRFANEEQRSMLSGYNKATIKKYEERIRLENLKGILEVRSYSGFYIVSPAVKVYIEDRYIGTVKKGATATFDIDKNCTVTFKCSIRSVSINVKKGSFQVVQLEFNRISGELLVNMIRDTQLK
jgi:hypothetical protein